jgi:hypothetical protein
MFNVKKTSKENRNYDVVLYTIICLAGGLLLAIGPFFSFRFDSKTIISGHEFSSSTEIINSIFARLVSKTNFWLFGNGAVYCIIAFLAAIIVIGWIGWIKGFYIKSINIVCSSAALLFLIIGSICGSRSFNYSHETPIARKNTSIYFEETFISFGAVYYIELILLIALLILSVASDSGVILLRKRKKSPSINKPESSENNV